MLMFLAFREYTIPKREIKKQYTIFPPHDKLSIKYLHIFYRGCNNLKRRNVT